MTMPTPRKTTRLGTRTRTATSEATRPADSSAPPARIRCPSSIRRQRCQAGTGVCQSGGLTFYGEDLAWTHDVGFDFWARGATPGVLRRLAAAGFSTGRVVDLGCGSGI